MKTLPPSGLNCRISYVDTHSGEDGSLLATRAFVSFSSTGDWAHEWPEICAWLEDCADALRPYLFAPAFTYRVDASAVHGDASRLEREFRAIANKRLAAI